ncbi:hypothetical protein EIP91_011623 [Steccherinum ochraceum]|uniref:Uncharacterized protein n=1 Tax=Steccherinum ochraceum TaxID=92696 RepID=A0A4R0RLH2_9APHY|nr:hypothetical protein EIP91_011623 [Steccherinum ochraceum]
MQFATHIVAVVVAAATVVVGLPASGNVDVDASVSLPEGPILTLPFIHGFPRPTPTSITVPTFTGLPTVPTFTGLPVVPTPTHRPPIACPLDAAAGGDGCPPGPIVEGPIDGMNPGPVIGGSGNGPIDGMNPGPVIN